MKALLTLLLLCGVTAAQAQSYPTPTFNDVITANDPRFYGLTTGSSDQAPAINAAIAHVASLGGGTVNVPAGTFSLQSQVLVKEFVTLQCQPTNPIGLLGVPARTGGTMFNVTWGSGAGSSDDWTKAAVVLKRTTAIDSCGFRYPQQVYTATTPIEFGPSIVGYETGVDGRGGNSGMTATNNVCFNCYSFLDFRGSLSNAGMAKLRIEYNWGAPIAFGLRINNVHDWSHYDHNIFHAAAYDFGDSTPWSHLGLWTVQHGVAIELGNSDWLNLNDEQEWGYSVGVSIVFNGTYSPSKGPIWISHSQFDSCRNACILDTPGSTDSGIFNLRVTHNTFTAFDTPAGSQSPSGMGAALNINNNSTIYGMLFADNSVFGPTNYVALGTATDIVIANNFSYSNAGSTIAAAGPAFTLGAGTSLVVTNNIMAGFLSVYTAGTFTNVVNTGNFTH